MRMDRLYILRQVSTKEVYAISEYKECIKDYIKLFDEYFEDMSLYEITVIKSPMQINQYLSRYQNYHIFPRGVHEHLMLTDWEWEYYKPFLKELYERAKDTIINLNIFSELYSYKGLTDVNDISPIMKTTANMFYDIAFGFDEFVQNLPIKFIKRKVLVEPIKAHKFNQFIQERYLSYKKSLE